MSDGGLLGRPVGGSSLPDTTGNDGKVLTVSTGGAATEWAAAPAPGGASGEIQFNDNGALGGAAGSYAGEGSVILDASAPTGENARMVLGAEDGVASATLSATGPESEGLTPSSDVAASPNAVSLTVRQTDGENGVAQSATLELDNAVGFPSMVTTVEGETVQAKIEAYVEDGGAARLYAGAINPPSVWSEVNVGQSVVTVSTHGHPVSDSSVSLSADGIVIAAGAALTDGLKITGLPTYADNAAATTAGMTAGGIYKTATGELRIVV